MRRALLSILVIAGIAAIHPSTAPAKASSELPYPLKESFGTSLRFIQVDRGCKVLERDADAAFITFDCPDAGKHKRGSLELFSPSEKSANIRLQLLLSDEPHYVELRFLELLERKLRDERGVPLPQKAPPAPPATDGGLKVETRDP